MMVQSGSWWVVSVVGMRGSVVEDGIQARWHKGLVCNVPIPSDVATVGGHQATLTGYYPSRGESWKSWLYVVGRSFATRGRDQIFARNLSKAVMARENGVLALSSCFTVRLAELYKRVTNEGALVRRQRCLAGRLTGQGVRGNHLSQYRSPKSTEEYVQR